MVTKIYALVWALLFIAGGFLHVTQNINELSVTVLGFLIATQVFLGMVAVLPWWVDRHYSWDYSK